MSSSIFDLSYADQLSQLGATARSGDDILLTELLSRAPTDSQPVATADNRGWNALHEAAAAGHHKCLRILLQFLSTRGDGDGLIDSATFAAETALMLAVASDHIECVRLLLESGANANQPTHDNSTAFFFIRSAAVAAVLLDRPDAQVNHKNDFEVTPLLNLLSRKDDDDPPPPPRKEQLDITQLLVERGNINCTKRNIIP
jgi:ankyrin repeat protein